MKGNKLIFSLLAGLTISGTLSYTGLAATSLTDIDGSYAKDAIQELVEKGILNGKGDGRFDPSGQISRQDFAIILAKSLNLDMSSPPATATFSDVPSDNYAFKYVEAAVKAGLIKGTGDGNFGAGNNLSRQDMAVLFVRALGQNQPTGSDSQLPFSDANSISDWAKNYVAAAVKLGLMSGNPDGTFNPTGNAERQAVAEVASKFLATQEKQNNSGTTSPPPGNGNTQTGGSTSGSTSGSSSGVGSGGSGGGTGGGKDSGNGSGGGKPTPQPVNHAPIVSHTLADVRMTAGDHAMSISLQGVFSDEDGDVLSYSAASSDPAKATVIISDGSLKVTPLKEGTVTITVSAQDGKGGTTTTTFKGSVNPKKPENHAPQVQHPVSAQTVTVGDQPLVIGISDVFADEDGDNLSVTVSSSDSTKLKVTLSDHKVTLSAVAEGKTTVMLVARDGRGGEVTSSFEVTIKPVPEKPNHSPVVKNALTDEYLYAGSAKAIDLSGVFFDEDADPLGLSAVSSDSGIASVTVAGNGLQITPISAGTARITITADDGKGSVTTSFAVTVLTPPSPVTNHPPMVANPISPVTVTLGNANGSEVFLYGVFTDTDNDTLRYEVRSANTNIATVSLTQSGLTISPVAQGTTTITVIARDGKGGSVSTSFGVTVTPPPSANNDPTVVSPSPLSSLTVTMGVNQEVYLYGVFTDADSDTLTYEASSANDAIVTVSVTDGILTIEPKAVVEPTTIKVTVTASDGKGGSVSTSFDVTVNPAASSQDNHDPTVVSPSPLSSLAVTMGMNQEVTLDGVFIDEDGDTLTYVASSADDAIVTVSVTDGILTIEPKAVVEPTTIKVTVTASDGKGGSVSTSFDVTVDPVA